MLILIHINMPGDCQQEYIHRVGRTARGINGRGHALLILRPEELGFLRFLKQAKVRTPFRERTLGICRLQTFVLFTVVKGVYRSFV